MSNRTIRSSSAEQRLGERAGELGLADAGRAEEEEAADRPVRVAESRARAPDRLGDRLDRLVLADDAVVQLLLQLAAGARAPRVVSWETGMPVARETTSAMSSAVTSGARWPPLRSLLELAAGASRSASFSWPARS